MPPPAWVRDAVFYQVFPDRFANGDPSNDPPDVRPWDSPPDSSGHHGGDLRGIRQKLDYLSDLGVTALYLNPIFVAPSNHHYDTADYLRVDPRLGGDAEFDALVADVHRRGMRLVLDGVFNHCGQSFFAFRDLRENGVRSAYREWFHVRRFPLDADGPGLAENYVGWWNLKSLPKFNTDHPPVRQYLLDVARHWIERGADGWRLDVPNEIDDDSFWAEFRATVKTANPDAYLVGEIWKAESRWVGEEHFDGLMLYPVRDLLLGFLGDHSLPASELLSGLARLMEPFPEEFRESQLLMLGSHDTERIRTSLGGRSEAVRLSTLVQFSLPGAPCIYYGDEIGLEGDKDPDCRRAFPWQPERWDSGLRAHVKSLIDLRRRLPALRGADTLPVLADDERRLVAYERRSGQSSAVVVLNASDRPEEIHLPALGLLAKPTETLVDAFGGAALSSNEARTMVTLPPYAGAVLVPRA